MKKLLQNRKIWYAVGSVLVIALIFLISGTPAFVTTAAATKKLPIYSVQRDDKCVSLTFDAAWGNEDTQTLLSILARYNIRATFFIVGSWAEKYPESVRALAEAGHEVMNHSDTHPHMTQLSAEQMQAELRACDDKVEALTGVRPILFRPPYGDYSDAVVAAARETGHYTIQWDVDSLDWKGISAAEITKRVLERAREGSVILFHNAAEHTPEALPGIIEGLMREGYSFLPVSELIYREGYEVDHTGRQHPAAPAVRQSAPIVQAGKNLIDQIGRAHV